MIHFPVAQLFHLCILGWHDANGDLRRLAEVRTIECNRRNRPTPQSLPGFLAQALEEPIFHHIASLSEASVHDRCRSLAPIAVGTLIAERPPHRTVRAAFPHTAPTLGNDGSTTRMQSNDWYTYAGAVSDARVALDCIPLGPRPSLH